MASLSDFVSNTRTQADSIIAMLDGMNNLGNRVKYGNITLKLQEDDFAGENSHLSPDQIFDFLDVMQRLIVDMPDDDKKKIYAIAH